MAITNYVFLYNYGICYYDTYCRNLKKFKNTTGAVFLHFFLSAAKCIVKTILNRPDILMTDNSVIITHIHVIPNLILFFLQNI